jgi:hypothetical protein
VFDNKLLKPTAVLFAPVVLSLKACLPIPVLKLAVVFADNALLPKAVF